MVSEKVERAGFIGSVLVISLPLDLYAFMNAYYMSDTTANTILFESCHHPIILTHREVACSSYTVAVRVRTGHLTSEPRLCISIYLLLFFTNSVVFF